MYMKLTKEQKKQLSEYAKKMNVDFIVLFGSQAKGKIHEKSDVDIGLKGLLIDSFGDYSSACYSLQKIFLDKKIDIAFLDIADPLLKHQVGMHGKLLFGDKKKFKQFQVNAWKEFVDTKDLRDLEKIIYKKRLSSLKKND